MQRISTHLVIVLSVLVIGIVVREGIWQRQARHVQQPGLLEGFPKQLASYAGRDVQTAEADTARADYHPEEILWREYLDSDGRSLELFIAPTRAGFHDMATCLRYGGGEITYARESYLTTLPPVRVREIVALSPPEESDQANACVYYWRGKVVGYENLLRVALRDKFDRLLGREENGFAVQVCTTLGQPSEADAVFGRLRAFASKVDPMVVAMLGKSEVSVESK